MAAPTSAAASAAAAVAAATSAASSAEFCDIAPTRWHLELSASTSSP